MGLKIVAVATEDWDSKAEKGFLASISCFHKNITSIQYSVLISTDQKHLLWLYFIKNLVFFYFLGFFCKKKNGCIYLRR